MRDPSQSLPRRAGPWSRHPLTSPSGRGGFGPAGPKTERATLSGRLSSILSDRTALSPCVALSVTASPCQLPQRGSQRGWRSTRPICRGGYQPPAQRGRSSQGPSGGYYPPLHGGVMQPIPKGKEKRRRDLLDKKPRDVVYCTQMESWPTVSPLSFFNRLRKPSGGSQAVYFFFP